MPLVAAAVLVGGTGISTTAAAQQPSPPPGFSVTPRRHDFGSVPISSASPIQTFTATNNGRQTVTINGVGFRGESPGDYVKASDDCTGELGRGESCTVGVQFRPTTTGSRPATLEFDFTNCGNFCGSYAVPLIGTGTPPEPGFAANPAGLNLGTVALGATSAAATVTISVTGPPGAAPRPMTIRRVSIPSGPGQFAGDYRIASDQCTDRTLVGGQTCTVSVVFSPRGSGTRPANLRFEDDAPGNPHVVGLVGTGAQPTIGVNPAVVFSGGVVTVVGAGWPRGAAVAITVQHLPAPVIATAGPDGRFSRPVVVFHTSTWGPRTVTANVQGSGGINSGAPIFLLVQAPSALPSNFVTR